MNALLVLAYLLILYGLYKIAFRYSVNNTFIKIRSFIHLPQDGGVFIKKLFLALFTVHELYILIVLKWYFWFLLVVPYLMFIFIAPRALKYALHTYVKDNEEAGISPQESFEAIKHLL